MLRQLKEYAKDCGMKELHLSVERDNIPSIKTIVRNGGVVERNFEYEGNIADVYLIEL